MIRLLQRALVLAACAGYGACGSDGDHDRPSDASAQPDVGRIDAPAAASDGASADTGAFMDVRRSDSAALPKDASDSLLDAGASVPEARAETGVPDADAIPDAGTTCRGDVDACSCDPTPCTCGASGVCGSDTAADPLRCCNAAEDSCTDPARCDFNPCIPLRCSPDSGLCSQLLPGVGKVPDGTPCDDGNRCSRARPAPVFQRCNVACESDGSPGCAGDQQCVLLAGTPGSAASGYCCPVGTACLAAGDYCVGNSGRGGPPAQIYDMCRDGECTYDIGPALNDTGNVDASAGDGSPTLADSGGSSTGSDAAVSCPPRVPPGGEPSVCSPVSCTDPSLNGQYNPCVIASQCLSGFCYDGGPVPDGTHCDDRFVRFQGPYDPAVLDVCRGPCTSADPPPPPGEPCECSSDCPPRHQCMRGVCTCNDGYGVDCNDVCRAGECVSDRNTCG